MGRNKEYFRRYNSEMRAFIDASAREKKLMYWDLLEELSEVRRQLREEHLNVEMAMQMVSMARHGINYD